MGRFLLKMLGMIWGFAESLEVSSLKKKLAKQTKANEEHEEYKKLLEADIEHLRSELNTSFSDRDSSEQEMRQEIASLKRERDTYMESNRALREKQERLELDLAKANATIEIRQQEKVLMVDLVKFHREEVRAAIMRAANSYGDHERPQRITE